MSFRGHPLGEVTPEALADELIRCRRRGLARLDAVVGSEPPVNLPVLEQLVAYHRSAGRRPPLDRGIALARLLREGIAALGEGRSEDAQLLTELFFGDSSSTFPAASPGELLDAARRRRGVGEAAFRRERRQVCLRLGRVLLDLVEPVAPAAESGVHTGASAVLALAEDPSARSDEILDRLREMAREYEVSEVLEVIVRFDTPDILG